MNTTDKPTQKLLPLICNAIALAAGVAVVVMSILQTLTFDTLAFLLGLGLALLALAALDRQTPRTHESMK